MGVLLSFFNSLFPRFLFMTWGLSVGIWHAWQVLSADRALQPPDLTVRRGTWKLYMQIVRHWPSAFDTCEM